MTYRCPSDPGATSVTYDALVSEVAGDFEVSTDCIYSGQSAPTTTDFSQPDPGGVFFYLIRAVNDCPDPDGTGTLGPDSNGAERLGTSCP